MKFLQISCPRAKSCLGKTALYPEGKDFKTARIIAVTMVHIQNKLHMIKPVVSYQFFIYVSEQK